MKMHPQFELCFFKDKKCFSGRMDESCFEQIRLYKQIMKLEVRLNLILLIDIKH